MTKFPVSSLLQIALCARVIGVHRLQCLGFYSYLHRYLQPKQKEVTRLLLYAAQACHELVPPDAVEQLVSGNFFLKKIKLELCYNFNIFISFYLNFSSFSRST